MTFDLLVCEFNSRTAAFELLPSALLLPFLLFLFPLLDPSSCDVVFIDCLVRLVDLVEKLFGLVGSSKCENLDSPIMGISIVT